MIVNESDCVGLYSYGDAAAGMAPSVQHLHLSQSDFQRMRADRLDGADCQPVVERGSVHSRAPGGFFAAAGI